MGRIRHRMRKVAAIVVLAAIGTAVLPAAPASATTLCDDYGHCLTVEGARLGVGAACWATASGPTVAVETSVTCNTGLASASASNGGNFAFVRMTGLVLRLCWSGSAAWEDAFAIYSVETQGCELI